MGHNQQLSDISTLILSRELQRTQLQLKHDVHDPEKVHLDEIYANSRDIARTWHRLHTFLPFWHIPDQNLL